MFSFFKDIGQKDNVVSVAFYNLDNFFDIFDDPDTFDDDYTPTGNKKWTYKRYKSKAKKLGKVISKIGIEFSPTPPVIVGLAELENETVIHDLIKSKYLKDFCYDYVHYDSPDERGIDVGLIFLKKYFELLDSKVFPLILLEEDGKRDYTRDILLVKGKLKGDLIYIIVNHWPSRREGREKSNYKRMAAAERVLQIVEEIKVETPNPKIIIMGDFNDGYDAESIKHLVKNQFFNPMERLKTRGIGSSTYNDEWYLFDQIIFSNNLLDKQIKGFQFRYADVYDPKYIRTWKGRRKNKPHRTFVGGWYQAGYSDHFPVYAFLEQNISQVPH